MASLSFNPTPSAQAALLDALADPSISLPTLAATHKTTTESLAAWITKDDTRARLALIQSAVLIRAQLIAAINQTAAIAAAMGILDAFKNARVSKRSDNPQPEAPTPADHSQTQPHPAPADTNTSSPDRHWCETARRAASLIFRMSQPQPAPRPTRPDSQAAPIARPPTTTSRQPMEASRAITVPSTPGTAPASIAPAPHRTTLQSPSPISPALRTTLDSPQSPSILSDFETSDSRSETRTAPAAHRPKRQGARAVRRAARLAELARQTSGP